MDARELATGIRARFGRSTPIGVRLRSGGGHGQPSAQQIARDVKDILEGRVEEAEAVARARRSARVSAFPQPQPPRQEPAPAPSPAQVLEEIRDSSGKVKYYEKDRGKPSISSRMPFAYNYIDRGGVIGQEDRFPTGTSRTWRLLEAHHGGSGKSVLSLESEIRGDGTFPPPPQRGTHAGRATIGMGVLQGYVDTGQVDIEKIELGGGARGTDADAQVRQYGVSETD
jgi:hypothetical protein